MSPGPICAVLLGCSANALSLERLTRLTDGAFVRLLTAAQFATVVLAVLPFFLRHLLSFPSSSPAPAPASTSPSGTGQSTISPKGSIVPTGSDGQVPIRRWAMHVALFMAASVLNNLALAHAVPPALQIIVRSASLPLSLVFARLFLGRTYPLRQTLAVILVTLGVLYATFHTPSSSPSHLSDFVPASNVSQGQPLDRAKGLALLSGALLLSAALGVVQERTYQTYPAAARSAAPALFYTHAMPLPLLALTLPSITHEYAVLRSTPPYVPSSFSGHNILSADSVPGVNSLHAVLRAAALALLDPLAWLPRTMTAGLSDGQAAMLANVLSQLPCIVGVNVLTASVSNLVVNLVLTARKAISLALSAWLFGAPFNARMLAGVFAVLVGTVAFALFAPPRPSPSSAAISKKKR